MTKKTTLLLGVHAHQPVGNFPSVIDEAVQRCYRPFLRTLYRFPAFRFSAHFSGWLLDYLLDHCPEDMELLKEMTQRGQVELFGAGDCEPVLAAIPHRDRVTQITALSDKLEQHFGARPDGAWLTERVWEATVVPALGDTAIRYVVVDDYHFLCAGLSGRVLDGYYRTEEDGRTVDVFPISEELRYRIPFSLADEAVGYLESLAASGCAAAVYFDDIEKFGIWPETYAWVYEKGWLERFIGGVLASPSIRTATYRDYHRENPARGVIYLPTTSYIEMNEWTLPPVAAAEYDRLVRQEKGKGTYQRSKAHLRGGIWRNFLCRYPESNWMHKRMLTLSDRLARVGGDHEQHAKLHRAQANDAYWHGLFGGLYLPHLRRAVWRNLIELERDLDARAPRVPFARGDLDLDGVEEVSLHSPDLQISMRLDGNAAIHEMDSYALLQNLCDTLDKRCELYYLKLESEACATQLAEGIASAHDRIAFRHAISPEDVIEDERPRASLLDSWTASGTRRLPIDGYTLERTSGPTHALEFCAVVGQGRIHKRIALDGPRLEISWRMEGLPAGRFATQLNLSMPSCDGYGGRYVLEDGSIPCGFGQDLQLYTFARLALLDDEMGGGVRLRAIPRASVSAAPYHTVSLSEAGFEKIMQAACLDIAWDVPPGNAQVRLELEVREREE